MTQDEIIEMAQECGLVGMRPHLDGIYIESLLTFAKLVAEAERERIKQDNAPEIEKINAYIDHAMREVQRLGQEIEQEPPKYSFKAHWEKDGRIGVVGAVVRPDGGVHLLQDIIDPPQRKPLTYCQECMRPNPIDGSDCAHGIKENR